jgi:hypothetical protein
MPRVIFPNTLPPPPSEQLLAPHPTPKLEDQISSAVRHWIFKNSRLPSISGGLLLQPQPGHAVVTTTHTTWGHGADSMTVPQSRNSTPFTEPVASFPCSQQTITDPYPEPDQYEYSPYSPNSVTSSYHLRLRLSSSVPNSARISSLPRCYIPVSHTLLDLTP